MRRGEVIEFWIWADGRETPEMLAQFKADMQTAVTERAKANRVLVTPVVMTEKRPGEDRVPDVPKHVAGPNVRLVGCQAVVIGESPEIKVNSFLGDLDIVDLVRLRTIMRRIAPMYGYKEELTDEWCDKMIEQIGPKAAEKAVRDHVDEKPLGWLHSL